MWLCDQLAACLQQAPLPAGYVKLSLRSRPTPKTPLKSYEITETPGPTKEPEFLGEVGGSGLGQRMNLEYFIHFR